MAEVDDRVVAMSFENSEFNSHVDETVGVLGRLKEALNLGGAAEGLSELDAAGRNIDLSGIGRSIDDVGNRFSVLSGAAAVALGDIAARAVEAGAEVVKSFTLDPVTEGFKNYEDQINAVQTITANTGLTGAAGLSKINGVLKDMQNYANLTVYNFGEMVKNIGTFTAAGVGLQQSESAIKGIANLAAESGAGAERASGAMYQLSQAIAAGQVHLQDWNSVVNAGIGGTLFQKALFNTAKAMGTIRDVPMSETFEQWKASGNSFYQSLSKTASKATTDAKDVLQKAQHDAAQTISDAQSSAADQIAQAAQRVKDAQRGVGDAVRQSTQQIQSASEQVKSAQQSESDTARQAAKSIEAAQQQIADAQSNVVAVYRQAAKDIDNAQQQVVSAHKAVTAAARQASKDVANAMQSQQDAFANAAQGVQSALDAVTQARQRLVEAMKPPSADELQAAQDKVTTAQLDQADLSDAVTRAQIEQTRAVQDLAKAQRDLVTVQASGTATADQIIQAQRAVQDAQQRVADTSDAQTRALLQQRAAARGVDQAQQDLQSTQQKGTAQDKNVQAAQDALTKALQQYVDAQKKAQQEIQKAEQNTRDVRIKSAQAQIAAEQNLTKAEQNLRDVRATSAQNEIKAEESVAKAEQNLRDVRISAYESEQKAQQAVIDAERNLRNVRISSAESQQKAGDALAQAEKDQAKTIQKAQEDIAKAHEEAANKIQAAQQKVDPNQNKSWLTAGVLANTLQQFSGDVSEAQLKAEGFTAAQAKQIEGMGKVALQSATQVRTFTQLTSSLREEVGTAWSQVFKALFGDIGQATTEFSGLHTTIENFLTNPIKDLAKVLQDWAQTGGRTALIDALVHSWHDLESILNAIKAAWRDIFPAVTGQNLTDLTEKFDAFIKKLTPSKQTLDEIKRIFEGVFAVFDIGKRAVSDLIGIFAHLFGIVTPTAGGGFLALAAHLGDFLVKVDDLLKKGGSLSDFFHNLFSGISSGGIGKVLNDITGNLPSLQKVGDTIQKIWDGILNTLQKFSPALHSVMQGIGDVFHSLVTFITNSFQNMNFQSVLSAIDTGLLGGLLLMFQKFFKGASLKELVGGGVLGPIKETLEGVTGSLKQVQNTLKAATLLEIGLAVGVLSASLLTLSTIKPDRLKAALAGMAVAFGELLASVALLNKISGDAGFLKLPAIGAGLILLGTAVDILAHAMKELSGLDWNQILKGLTGVGVLLAEISVAVGPLSANSKGMITAGLGITAIATGIRILVGAVRGFGEMNLSQLAKGLVSVGVALGEITLAARFMPTAGMVSMGLGLIGVATALKIIGSAMETFAKLDVHGVATGIFGIASSLGTIAVAMNLMPKGLAIQAVGLDLIAVALAGIAHAIKAMGVLSGNEIGKGLLGLGGALTGLAVALNSMDEALPGALALTIAATGLDLLAGAMRVIGGMSVGDIVKALVAMGVAMGGLGLAATALAPAAPAILAFGAALISVGAGIALAGGGIFLLGTGLAAIAVAGPAAIALLLKALEGLVNELPKMLTSIVDAVLHIGVAIADAAPQLVSAFGKLLVALGQAVIDAAPALANAMVALIEGVLHVINKAFPDIVKAGIGILMALLRGIGDNIGKVVVQVGNIIVHFLSALAKELPKIISAGAELLAKFIVGIANSYVKIGTAAVTAVIHFVNGIASSAKKVVNAGINLIGQFLNEIIYGGTKLFNIAVTAISHFLSGVISTGGHIVTSAINLAGKFINEIEKAMLALVNTGARAVINFLNGVANAIRKYSPQLWDAGWNIATAIIDGLAQGVENLAGHVWDKIKSLVGGIPGWAKHILGISSPSSVFFEIGQNTVQGLLNGISNNSTKPVDAIQNITNGMVETMSAANSTINDLLDFHSPTIKPVMDLSEIKKSAYLIQSYIPPVQAPLFLAASANPAAPVADPFSSDTSSPGTVVNFEQNNYSPAALSEVDIYRATKNTLSQLGGSTIGSDAAFFSKKGS